MSEDKKTGQKQNENKTFFSKRVDNIKTSVKQTIDDSDETSIIALFILIAKTVYLFFLTIGETIGSWLSDKDKEMKEKKDNGTSRNESTTDE